MEFYIADSDRRDLGFLNSSAELDFDIGSTDDFVLKINLDDYDPLIYASKYFIYCPDTEYGGILDDPEVITDENIIQFTGDTFRGILKKKCIEPPNNQAYRMITGELNACLKQLVDMHFVSLFEVPTTIDTGVSVTNFKFNRYCTLYDGIVSMLKSVGYKLKIDIQIDDTFKIILSAAPIVDYSEEIEYSQDCSLKFQIKQYTNYYDYMICLGQGELTERTVKYLAWNSGNIKAVNSIPAGDNIRIYTYDYSSAEDDASLISYAEEKFREINKTAVQKISLDDSEEEYLELGDIIGGHDYVTGITVAQPITNKIINLKNNKISVSYKIGDDE